jgi:hypothetical protein
MFSAIRPDSEVVNEGWILIKIKHIQNQIVSVFYLIEQSPATIRPLLRRLVDRPYLVPDFYGFCQTRVITE